MDLRCVTCFVKDQHNYSNVHLIVKVVFFIETDARQQGAAHTHAVQTGRDQMPTPWDFIDEAEGQTSASV